MRKVQVMVLAYLISVINLKILKEIEEYDLLKSTGLMASSFML